MAQGVALAVLGAAGLNGENLLQLLSASNLAYASLRLLDEDSQLGRKIPVADRMLPLEIAEQVDFQDIDLVLACAPPSTELMERIRSQGASLIAPTSVLPDAEPLVAELNLARQPLRKGAVLALPGAEATVVARLLAPLQDELGLLGVHSHWTRSISLLGRPALEALAGESVQLLSGKGPSPRLLSDPVAFNLISLDCQPQERDLAQLWHHLWGDNRLILSINSVLAPLFFGDIVGFHIEIEQPSSRQELAELLQGIDDVLLQQDDSVGLSAALSKETEQIHLGALRQLDEEGRHFSFQIALDTARVGYARNLLKITDYLVKNLFISYS